jgi:hypothetical protein
MRHRRRAPLMLTLPVVAAGMAATPAPAPAQWEIMARRREPLAGGQLAGLGQLPVQAFMKST